MSVQYNEIDPPPNPERIGATLAIDSGSPIVSVAVGTNRCVLTTRSLEVKESSSRLLHLIDSTLDSAALSLDRLDTVIGLRGPGGFTGLRVGLATIQGIAMAIPIRVGTLSTFDILASLAPDTSLPIFVCVNALRGEWLIQKFDPSGAVDQPILTTLEDLTAHSAAHWVGFGISQCRSALAQDSGSTFTEPGPLAPTMIEILEESTVLWGEEGLTNPFYQRPPAAIASKR